MTEKGGSCQNCGSPDEALAAVKRIYLEFDDGEVTGSATVQETEWWCRACRSTYPNEPASS
jgi:hypothetical protein